MILLICVILGLASGILFYLPVSSLGIVYYIKHFTGYEYNFLLLQSFISLGAMLGYTYSQKKELQIYKTSFMDIVTDLLHNMTTYYISIKDKTSNPKYIKIINSESKQIVLLSLISFIPSALIAFFSGGLQNLLGNNIFLLGALFFLNGLILIVSCLGTIVSSDEIINYDNKELHQGMWIGIVQGLCTFPGLSRLGLTFITGKKVGLKGKFAYTFSYLVAIPFITISFVVSVFRSFFSGFNLAYFISCIFAGIVSFIISKYFGKKLYIIGGTTRLSFFGIISIVLGVLIFIIR